MNILYIIAGDGSLDEMFFLDTFITQLSTGDVTNVVLAGPLPVSHLDMRHDNMRLCLARQDFDHEAWQNILEEFQPNAVILCDPSILLHEDAEHLTFFKLEWLDELTCPLAVFDFKANLLMNQDGNLALDEYLLKGKEPPYQMDYDFLIKICPPHDALPTQNPRLLQWHNMDLMPSLAIHSVREETRNQLGCEADRKMISLIYPVENILLAGSKGWIEHFYLCVDMLIYYLNQMKGRYHLNVINLTPRESDYEFNNVYVRHFQALEQSLVSSLLKSSDLFITQSLTHPILIQSALNKIPSICLGSSVHLNQGELQYAFDELSPFAELKVEELKDMNPDLLFPYISFPHPLKRDWPKLELFSKRFFFFLADIFNEQQVLQYFNELLYGGPRKEHFLETLNTYKERKLTGSDSADQIIKTLVTAPPRYLNE